MDGNSAAETVQPLLLVEDVVDLQRVRLCLARVLGTHTENVLGCGREKKKSRMSELIYLTEDDLCFFFDELFQTFNFNKSLTFVCIAESSSEGAAHSDVSILQVLQHEILHWDWLPVNLETVALVPGDRAGQDQQLGEQEHM